MMKMNEVIRQRRKELGLTQDRVAELLGVSKGGNAPIWHTTLRSKV